MDGIDGITRTSAGNGGTSGTLRITSTIHPPGVRLEGELDRSGMPAVRAALASATHRVARGDGLLHTDLSGLDFIDVGGLRVLLGAGPDAGDGSPGVIRTVAASAAVRRLLTLTGWDATPGWSQAPGEDQAPPAGVDEVRPDAGEGDPDPVAGNTGVVDGGG